MTDRTVRVHHPRRSAAMTRNPAIRRDDGVMNPEDKFARWHWRTLAESGSIASVKEYEFRLIHRYVPVEQFPFVEGHQLTLEWRDLFYPEALPDGLAAGSLEKYVTEDFRRATMVVRAHGVAGVPIWTEHIADGLSVQVALATPEQRFGDNMAGDNVFRVSYQFGGQRWYIARYDPSRAELSAVVATELER